MLKELQVSASLGVMTFQLGKISIVIDFPHQERGREEVSPLVTGMRDLLSSTKATLCYVPLKPVGSGIWGYCSHLWLFLVAN